MKFIESWNDEPKFFLDCYPSCIDGGGLRVNCGNIKAGDDFQVESSVRLSKDQVKQLIKELKNLLKWI